MPRYFFHMIENGRRTVDEDGLDLPTPAAIHAAAVAGLGGIVAEAVGIGRLDYDGRLEVEDAAGRRVMTLTCRCPIEIEVAPSFGATAQATMELGANAG